MPAHYTEERNDRRAGTEACPYEWLICSSAHVTEVPNDRRAGTEACPYEWLFCSSAQETEERNDRRADTAVRPYEWLDIRCDAVITTVPSIGWHLVQNGISDYRMTPVGAGFHACPQYGRT